MSNAPLPPALASDERFAVLSTLAEEAFSEIDLSILLVYLIDLVPAHILPHLADQFHVMGLEGWEFADTELKRRDLIKQAIELHRYKGTPWAIEQVLVSLGMKGAVSEWFEYGGQPYRFKIDIDLSGQGLGLVDYEQLVSLVMKYKNKRSQLDMLNMGVTVQSPVPVIAGAMSLGETITVYPWSLTELKQSTSLYRAAGCWVVETVSIFPST